MSGWYIDPDLPPPGYDEAVASGQIVDPRAGTIGPAAPSRSASTEDSAVPEPRLDVQPDQHVLAELDALDAEPEVVKVFTLSNVVPERVEWAWRGRLPLGKVVVLDGDPGGGKSTLAVDIGARVTTGSPMPDGDRSLDGPRDVIYLSAEDGIADTLRPRLDAAYGDPSRFHVLDSIAEETPDGPRWRPPRIPLDCPRLEALIVRTGAVLVVVDVIAAYLEVRDGHSDGDVRRALHPLAAVAARTGAVVVVVRHLRKTRGSAMYAGGGSIGLIGQARVGMLAAADPADETGAHRVLAVYKSNLAAMPSALAYRLVDSPEHGCARVRWDGPTGHRADDLLAAADPDEDEGSDAENALAEVLADGPIWVKRALDAMADAGFSKDQTKRAKGKLHVRSVKVGGPNDSEQGWKWEMPRTTTESEAEVVEGSEGCRDSHPAPFAPFNENTTDSEAQYDDGQEPML